MTKARKEHTCDLCRQAIEKREHYHRETFVPWVGDNDGFSHATCCAWCMKREESTVDGDADYTYQLNPNFEDDIRERFRDLFGEIFGFPIDLDGEFDPSAIDQAEIYHYRKYGWARWHCRFELVEGCTAKLAARKFVPA